MWRKSGGELFPSRFFLKILPLKDDELVMSEMQKKMGGHRTSFDANMLGRTPKSE